MCSPLLLFITNDSQCVALTSSTCTEVGGEERGKADNLEFGSPYVRRDLSKVVVL